MPGGGFGMWACLVALVSELRVPDQGLLGSGDLIAEYLLALQQ